jgi:hypothetical protein
MLKENLTAAQISLAILFLHAPQPILSSKVFEKLNTLGQQ